MLRCQEKTRVERFQSKIPLKSTYVGVGEEKRTGEEKGGREGKKEEGKRGERGELLLWGTLNVFVHVTVEAKGKHSHQQFSYIYKL